MSPVRARSLAPSPFRSFASSSARAAAASRMTSYTTDGLPPAQRRWAMLTLLLSVSLAVLDGAIANIALPQIGRDLQTSPAHSIWVVNAYQLVITISLLP